MHNIVFFSNHFARRSGTGITRYARNLVKAFSELNAPYKVIPVATWTNRGKDELHTLKAETGLRLLSTGRWLSPLLWMTIGIPKIEHLLDFQSDIVHVNDMGYLVATSKPYVVTVHDLGPLTHQEHFKNNSFWIVQKSLEQALKKDAALICVSHATANSLKEYVQERYAVDLSNRTHVVYEGISENFFQIPNPSTINNGSDIPQQPFILAVGKISPRKNLEVVIRALKKLQSSIPHHLVTVGGDGWDFQGVKSLANSLGLADRVHFLGYVSDETLNLLYNKAALFVYPSLFEGFGLPVLEAMASGCPVVTSNISSLPEVAGDAALLVDPYNVEDIASAVETVCKDLRCAEELKQKGRERANLFSWKKCAEETSAVYDNLIS
jgi:glycosyltransferase involved in cell wall biosynthesis